MKLNIFRAREYLKVKIIDCVHFTLKIKNVLDAFNNNCEIPFLPVKTEKNSKFLLELKHSNGIFF